MSNFEERISALPSEKRQLLEVLLREELSAASVSEDKDAHYIERKGPASFSQERLWILDQLESGNPSYNVAGGVSIYGELSVRSLQKMFEALVARHEVLRTTFDWSEGCVEQRVHKPFRFELPVIDLTSLSASEREDVTRTLAQRESRHTFSLTRGPLLRAIVIRHAPTEHVVVFVMHHIIADGWSASILVREMSILYRSELERRPAALPPLPIQYLEFATKQRSRATADHLEAHFAYWENRLRGHSPLLDLPTDRSRGPKRGQKGALQHHVFPSALSDALREFSRARKVTLFVTVLTVFKVLLHRYTRQADLIVGTSVANRMQKEIEDLIGCFVNVLPLRTQIDASQSISDLLPVVRNTVLEAFAHQELPFELLVERLNPERNVTHSPVFQTMFVFQNVPTQTLEMPNVSLRPMPVHSDSARFDLTIEIRDTGLPLAASIEYDASLFDPSTIDRLVADYEGLLWAATEFPEAPIHRLPLSSGQLTELAGNPQTSEHVAEFSDVVATFAKLAAAHPEHSALVSDRAVVTYDQLMDLASSYARELSATGVGPGSLVAVTADRSDVAIPILLGIWLARCAYVFLDGRDTQILSAQLETCRADALVQHRAEGGTTIRLLPSADSRNENEFQVRADGSSPLACVILKAGMVDDSQRVEISHHSILQVVQFARGCHGNPDGVFLLTAALSDHTSLFEMWGALLNGAQCVCASRPNLTTRELIDEAIVPYAITTLQGDTHLIAKMLEESQSARLPLTDVVLFADPGVARLTAEANSARPSVRLHCVYTLPELPYRLQVRTDETTGPRLKVCGKEARKLRVLDEHFAYTPIGTVGNLYFDEARSPLRLLSSSLHARYLSSGEIELVGPQATRAGYRIHCWETLAAAYEFEPVRSARLETDSTGSDRIVLHVEPRIGCVCTADAVAKFLRERLPTWNLPDEIVIEAAERERDFIDLVSDRRTTDDRQPTLERDRSDVENTLRRLWCEVLAVESVDRHDNFFALGGDSILSVQIAARAREAGIRLHPQLMFEAQTIAELAPLVEVDVEPTRRVAATDATVPMAPIQRWLVETQGGVPTHFNQALLLEMSSPVRAADVREAFRSLMETHDALCLRVERHEGEWSQWCASPDKASIPFLYIEAPQLSTALVQHISAETQQSLDPVKGPIFRAVLMRSPQKTRLLIVIHHLAVDAYSWSIILRGLERAYTQINAGEPVAPGVSGTPWLDWVRQLDRYALEQKVVDELPFWLRQLNAAGTLPVERRIAGSSAGAKTIISTLDRATTSRLDTARRTDQSQRMDDALLAALVRAVSRKWKLPGLMVDCESHGRAASLSGVDLSNTVGWFTVLYPLYVEYANQTTFANTLAAVRTLRSQLRDDGITYGLLRYLNPRTAPQLVAAAAPSLSFNFLGRVERMVDRHGSFRLVNESMGETAAGSARTAHPLQLNASVVDEEVVCAWTYDANQLSEHDVTEVVAAFAQELRDWSAKNHETVVDPVQPYTLAGVDREQFAHIANANPDLEDLYPLTSMQEAMLVHSLYGRGNNSYVEQFSARLAKGLDFAALQSALARVVELHPVLRTSFAWEDLPRPLQVIHRDVQVPMAIEQLQGELNVSAIDAALARDRAKGFDPSKAPLHRWTLLQAADESCLIWSFHHILLDGWSMALVIQQLCELITAQHSGESSPSIRAKPYRAYLDWLQQQDEQKAERFWRERLRGFHSPTRIPVQQRAQAVLTTQYAEVDACLDEAFSDELRAFCRRERLTLNTVFQAMWAVMLSRYTGNQDIVFGATASGRPADLVGVETIVGLFINTLPVRLHVPEEEVLATWLARVQLEQAQARAFEHVSLPRIHGWSEISRTDGLFESILVFENYPVADVARASNGLLSDINVVEHPHFPLLVVIVPSARITLRLKFACDRFSGDVARRMLDHFTLLLTRCVESASLPVARLELVAHHALRTPSNFGPTRSGESASIVDVIESIAERQPHATAVIVPAGQMSFGELNWASNRLARTLVRRGIQRESLVPILLDRGPEMLIAILAVLKAGAAYIPLDANLPDARICALITEADATVILTQQQYRARLQSSAAQIYCVDGPADVSSGADSLNLATRIHPNQLAYVLYTSGSTGKPNGVMVSHRGLSNYLDWCVRAYSIAEGEGAPVHSPLSFDLTITSLLGPLIAGRPVCLLANGQDVERLSNALQSGTRWSLIKITPAHLELLGRTLAGTAASSARVLVVGGDALHGQMLAHWRQHAPDVLVVNEYGPTETVVGCCIHTLRAGEADDTEIPIGRPIDNTSMYVLDPLLRPVPIGCRGEIYIGGQGVARGYLQNPSLTAARFLPDPLSPVAGARMYRTGDVGWQDEHGTFHYGGRFDNQLKIRGHRVEPAEIEAQLLQRAEVESVAVVPTRFRNTLELVAFVTSHANVSIDVVELRDQLKKTLPDYMVPARLIHEERLPLTDRGKVDRKALLQTLSQREKESNPARGATQSASLEQRLTDIWQQVLDVDGVRLDDNFFDAGGHSLLLIQVQDRLKATLDVDVSIVDLFKYPTIRSLAQRLRTHTGESHPSIAPDLARRVESGEIAIIGIAGRFPGARTVDELWANLCAGTESIATFTADQLRAAGVSPELSDHPNYVKAGAVLEGVELFDASFFGMSAREAEITDPQHRLFLECAHEALERAAYDPTRYTGRIGVFASTFMSSYLLAHLGSNPDVMRTVDTIQLICGNDKDFLATRVSYKLGLRGPSVNVQTACSSSLVAVHTAIQSLRTGACEMALAGGVAIRLPQHSGYLYQEDGVLSKDGHCRPFAEDATGFVGGSGCGVVVLKRLQDALRDRDHIHAVIRGSAVNNDGKRKVGFTAPSLPGQVEAVQAALIDARVPADSIGYIEAHGTGTRLGDPIEISALAEALSTSGARTTRAIGSIKSNLGHLDAAAGVVGLIKTTLQVEHGKIAPSLHCPVPNKHLDLERSGFYINTTLREWGIDRFPRRAGVSSFGMGGTNAHVILEQAPTVSDSPGSRPWQLLALSAMSSTALAAMKVQLASHIESHPEQSLSDIAFTLTVGRRNFDRRDAILCSTADEAVRELRKSERERIAREPEVVLWLGDFAHLSPWWTQALSDAEPTFRGAMDKFLSVLGERQRHAVRRCLFEADVLDVTIDPSAQRLARICIHYSLASLWLHWGMRPQTIYADGLDELAAALIAGALVPESLSYLLTLAHDDSEHELRNQISRMSWPRPTVPYYSALKNAVLDEPITEQDYWLCVLRAGKETLEPAVCRAEVKSAVVLCFGTPRSCNAQQILSCTPVTDASSTVSVYECLTELWQLGLNVSWDNYFSHEHRRRVPLPTYPFDRERYWIEPATSALTEVRPAVLERDPQPSQWVYQTVWERCLAVPAEPAEGPAGAWVCMVSGTLGLTIASALEEQGAEVERLLSSPLQQQSQSRNAAAATDIQTLLKHASTDDRTHVLFAVDLEEANEHDLTTSFLTLLHLLRQIATTPVREVQLTVITSGAQEVTGTESLNPNAATLLGLCRVATYECPKMRWRVIDVECELSRALIDKLVQEIRRESSEELRALRGQYFWRPCFNRVQVDAHSRKPVVKPGGVYIITGGTGPVGLQTARYLATQAPVCIALLTRTNGLLREPLRQAIEQLEHAGSQVLLIQADVGDEPSMRAAVAQVMARFGRINGLIHAAGVRIEGSLHTLTVDECNRQFHAKMAGIQVLDRVLPHTQLDFVLLLSSLASLLGLYGLPAYPAAHLYMDIFAQRRNRIAALPWTIVNLDNWDTEGVFDSKDAADGFRMTASEGCDVLDIALNCFAPGSHLIVSTADLASRCALRDRFLQPVQVPADTSAVPTVHQRGSLSSVYREPRTVEEKLLTNIWEQALGVVPIGIDDDYFELGGDSVTSLQIVARAREQGIPLTTQLMFERSTISALDVQVNNRVTILAEQEEVNGTAPLTPIQHWFFAHEFIDPHHWNQAMYLPVPANVTAPALKDSVRALLQHHDALRTRFRREANNRTQYFARTDSVIPFVSIDLSAIPADRHAAIMENAAESAQRSLDLYEGPLFRAVHFRGAVSSAVLLIAHHLVVDATSWRILSSDLQTLWSGRTLPPKTSSVRAWASALLEQARDGSFDDERDYWERMHPNRFQRLPVDFGSELDEDDEASLRVLAKTLEADCSKALLRDLPRRLSLRTDELLLGILASTLRSRMGLEGIAVDVESNGRNLKLRDDLDVSRTVGWFTAVYPMFLTAHADGPLATMMENRTCFERVPRNGITYGVHQVLGEAQLHGSISTMPRAELSFVYLGTMQTTDASLNTQEPKVSLGMLRSPRARAPYRISVHVVSHEDVLTVHWVYSSDRYARETIEALADEFLVSARRLVQVATADDAISWDANRDAALFGWSQSDIKKISSAVKSLDS